MDINGSGSSSVIESVMRTASPEAVSAVKTLNKANELQQQSARQLIESVPEPATAQRSAPESDSRVGRNLDVKA